MGKNAVIVQFCTEMVFVCCPVFCDSGFIINSGNDGCDACGVGTYKAQRGNTDQCINCPSNTTTSGVASTSESDCNKGKYTGTDG